MAELRPLQLFDDRFQALDLTVAVLDGGSHIANKMLQMSRFGRQIVGIEMHARIHPIRVIRRSDFVRFYAGFCSFLALQSRLPYAFEDRQSVPSISIASCAGVGSAPAIANTPSVLRLDCNPSVGRLQKALQQNWRWWPIG